MAKVYIRFPKVGLGNMLLVWARGVVFARLNKLPFITSSWWGLHWGALLRREKKSRLYLGCFIETPLWKQWAMGFYCKFANVEKNPEVKLVAGKSGDGNKVYVFNKALTQQDVFGALREHQSLVAGEINSVLTPKMKLKLSLYEAPFIGIHIRRGDFKLGNQSTPLAYFIHGINLIRSTIGQNIPVTVFTDAGEEEIEPILRLPNINVAEDKADILDILLLSRSKIMMLSKSSTFGYWAAFLSDAIVIRPIDDWQQVIKYGNAKSQYAEIKWHFDDAGATAQIVKKISLFSDECKK